MKAYVVICNYNLVLTLVDSVYQDEEAAKAHVAELNGDREKAISRCKELIAKQQGAEMVEYLSKEGIEYLVHTAEMK